MEQVASEVLRAIRGHRSQVAFSRWLAYKSNVAADWEAGRRFPTAAEAFRAADRVGLDVLGAFRRFHAPALEALGAVDDAGVAAWLTEMKGSTSFVDLAERTGRSRYAVARWLSGDSRPRLPDFFRLVEAMTRRVSDLVAGLVDIERVPALTEHHERVEASRGLVQEEPWAGAVMLLLETVGYGALPGHDDGWMARVLGLEEPRVRLSLERLVRAGVIERKGRHWTVCGPLTVDAQAAHAATRGMQRHWARVAADRVDHQREQDVLAFNLFSVSREDLGRIADFQRSFYREVRAIAGASERPEVVALLNAHLVSWSPDLTSAEDDPCG